MEKMEKVELEEMDWVQARDSSKETIRQGLLMVEMGKVSYEKACKELNDLWGQMPLEEREKREKK